MADAVIHLPVGLALRYVLYALSVRLDIDLSAGEIERMFLAADADDISDEGYVLHHSNRAHVERRSEEHELGFVSINVRSRSVATADLIRFASAAEHASFGQLRTRD